MPNAKGVSVNGDNPTVKHRALVCYWRVRRVIFLALTELKAGDKIEIRKRNSIRVGNLCCVRNIP